jgi:hypothetical protein
VSKALRFQETIVHQQLQGKPILLIEKHRKTDVSDRDANPSIRNDEFPPETSSHSH